MPSASVVCCIYLQTLLTNVSIEENSVDPDQTAQSEFESTLSKSSEKKSADDKTDICCEWRFDG